MARDKCFVIMPFGIKPMPDEQNRPFDFDKVYRTVIRRSVQEAGMEAIRADEQTGSHIIHSDMFKELRDRAVVLADLSLGNPNVYYELGIRHVLAPGGTVLICREGTELPFDVRLSRVVFYRYDGRDIDWEVVEDFVPRLKAALETAKEQKPDSPVHALLERVYPVEQGPASTGENSHTNPGDLREDLSIYVQMVAELWHKEKADTGHLIERHGSTVFGARALGEFCLQTSPLGAHGARIAFLLYNHAQYSMSCRLFEQLHEEEAGTGGYVLSARDLIYFGSAVSERDPTVAGAEEGLSLMELGLSIAGDKPAADVRLRLHNSMAGLLMWKWKLTENAGSIDEAIRHLSLAIEAAEEMKREGTARPLGRIAKLHLRLLVGLRRRDGTPERKDFENCRNAILSLDESQAIDSRDASYLRWYKAIVHADTGREDAVREGVLRAVREDSLILRARQEQTVEIGAMQYTVLRRFISDNLPYLRNHTLLGYISQALQFAIQHPSGKR